MSNTEYFRIMAGRSFQQVKGLIIALEDDLRIRRALSVAQGIDFMTYEIEFRLRRMAWI